jgi:FixJ family two-component response regulator/glycine cleavage system H lipoate-binding protein
MTTPATEILVVDDEQVILDAVSRICSAEGHCVDTALDASIALSKLHTRQYRLVISDILMPELDGFQLLDHISKKQPQTPVIMATGFSTVENAVRSLYAGAIDFIPKPFTADELLSAVSRGLRYREIQERRASAMHGHSDPASLIVPCPPRYLRLGYASWVVQEEDGTARIGITHMCLRTIDRLIGIELMKAHEETVQGTLCAQLKTADGLSHPVLAPVSGKILESHEEIASQPELIEKDPYFKGWLYRVIPQDVNYELPNLIPCGSE